MYEAKKGGRPGVPKNDINTLDMVDSTNILMKNEQVCFSEVYGSSIEGVTAHDVKIKLITQICQFRPEFKGMDASGRNKYKLQGGRTTTSLWPTS